MRRGSIQDAGGIDQLIRHELAARCGARHVQSFGQHQLRRVGAVHLPGVHRAMLPFALEMRGLQAPPEYHPLTPLPLIVVVSILHRHCLRAAGLLVERVVRATGVPPPWSPTDDGGGDNSWTDGCGAVDDDGNCHTLRLRYDV